MTRKQQGFTLIELVVVIVILGILAAVAIPRYVGLTTEARVAAVNGLAGAVRSAVMLVQSRWVATGSSAASVQLLDGTFVTVGAAGFPTANAAGIGAAVNLGGTGGTFVFNGTDTFNLPTTVANCNVVYTAATGAAAVNTGGC